MIGIVLYSINDNNISTITEAFKSEGGFGLYINKPGDRVSDDSDLKGKKLAIFDIAGLDINDRNITKNLAANTVYCHKSGLGILFILHPGQSKILFENEVISEKDLELFTCFSSVDEGFSILKPKLIKSIKRNSNCI